MLIKRHSLQRNMKIPGSITISVRLLLFLCALRNGLCQYICQSDSFKVCVVKNYHRKSMIGFTRCSRTPCLITLKKRLENLPLLYFILFYNPRFYFIFITFKKLFTSLCHSKIIMYMKICQCKVHFNLSISFNCSVLLKVGIVYGASVYEKHTVVVNFIPLHIERYGF